MNLLVTGLVSTATFALAATPNCNTNDLSPDRISAKISELSALSPHHFTVLDDSVKVRMAREALQPGTPVTRPRNGREFFAQFDFMEGYGRITETIMQREAAAPALEAREAAAEREAQAYAEAEAREQQLNS